MGRHALTTLVVALTILMAGCDVQQFSSPTSSSDLVNAFIGNWTSSSLHVQLDAVRAHGRGLPAASSRRPTPARISTGMRARKVKA